jgi:hypothetical protein
VKPPSRRLEAALIRDANALVGDMATMARQAAALNRRAHRYAKAHPLPAGDPRRFSFAEYVQSNDGDGGGLELVQRAARQIRRDVRHAASRRYQVALRRREEADRKA